MEKQITNTSHFVHFDRLNSISAITGIEFDNTFLKIKDYSFSSFDRIIKQSKSPHKSNWINEFVHNENVIIEFGDKIFISNLNLLKDCFDKIDEKKILKEIIFENVRRIYYQNKPSRLNSLFLADVNQAEYWMHKLTKSFNGQCNILTLELTQIVHLLEVDSSFLLVKSEVISYIEDAAHSYWRGEKNSLIPDRPEYLFVGKATVIDQEKIYPK